jgi:hypothetical protein
MLKRRHCFEPYLKDKKKLWKTTGINTDIIVGITALVEVKTYTRWAKSFSATVQVECYTFLEVRGPYTKHCTWRTWPVSHATGGQFPTLTANISPVHSLLASSLTYILLPTSAKRLFAERVFDFVKECFESPCILASGCIGMRSVRDFMLPPRCKCGLLECYST